MSRPVIRMTILAACIAVAGNAVIARGGGQPPPVLPGLEAQAAMEMLGEASVPLPLAGSDALDPPVFRHAAGCDDLRTAYAAPGAPVPRGALVSVALDGGLRVDTRFGPAAVFLRDEADGACTYEIRTTHNLVVAGPGLPALDDFVTLACFEPFSIALLAFAEIDVDGQPFTLAIGQSATLGGSSEPEPFTVAWMPGHAVDLLATGDAPPGSVSIEDLPGTWDPVARSGTVSGTGPNGQVDVRFECTLGNLTIPGI